jgi:hypothetical protein
MWTPARDLLMNKIQRAFEKKNIIWRQHALESIYSRYGTFSRKWHNKKREEMICIFIKVVPCVGGINTQAQPPSQWTEKQYWL